MEKAVDMTIVCRAVMGNALVAQTNPFVVVSLEALYDPVESAASRSGVVLFSNLYKLFHSFFILIISVVGFKAMFIVKSVEQVIRMDRQLYRRHAEDQYPDGSAQSVRPHTKLPDFC